MCKDGSCGVKVGEDGVVTQVFDGTHLVEPLEEKGTWRRAPAVQMGDEPARKTGPWENTGLPENDRTYRKLFQEAQKQVDEERGKGKEDVIDTLEDIIGTLATLSPKIAKEVIGKLIKEQRVLMEEIAEHERSIGFLSAAIGLHMEQAGHTKFVFTRAELKHLDNTFAIGMVKDKEGCVVELLNREETARWQEAHKDADVKIYE